MDINLEKKFELDKISNYKLTRDIIPALNVRGDFTELKGKDAIVNSVRNLLLCPKGTYPFDPNYGSDIHKEVFEDLTAQTKEAIRFDLEDCIEEYVDGVTLTGVDIEMIDDKKTAVVNLYLQIQDEVNKTKLSLDVKKSGEVMFETDEEMTTDINSIG